MVSGNLPSLVLPACIPTYLEVYTVQHDRGFPLDASIQTNFRSESLGANMEVLIW